MSLDAFALNGRTLGGSSFQFDSAEASATGVAGSAIDASAFVIRGAVTNAVATATAVPGLGLIFIEQENISAVALISPLPIPNMIRGAMAGGVGIGSMKTFLEGAGAGTCVAQMFGDPDKKIANGQIFTVGALTDDATTIRIRNVFTTPGVASAAFADDNTRFAIGILATNPVGIAVVTGEVIVGSQIDASSAPSSIGTATGTGSPDNILGFLDVDIAAIAVVADTDDTGRIRGSFSSSTGNASMFTFVLEEVDGLDMTSVSSMTETDSFVIANALGAATSIAVITEPNPVAVLKVMAGGSVSVSSGTASPFVIAGAVTELTAAIADTAGLAGALFNVVPFGGVVPMNALAIATPQAVSNANAIPPFGRRTKIPSSSRITKIPSENRIMRIAA